MQCVKTGADIYLVEYGTTYRGDVYKISDVWMFKINEESVRFVKTDNADIIVHKMAKWFRDWPRTTLIVAHADRVELTKGELT